HESQFGQAKSIQCGLQQAERNKAEAIMIILADQPFITVNMINALIKTYYEKSRPSFVASCRNGITCPPILFSRHLFPDLHTLQGDRGAKYLLAKKAEEGIFLNFPNQAVFYDIDTVKDYEWILTEDSL